MLDDNRWSVFLCGAHVCVAKTSVSQILGSSPRLSPPDSLSFSDSPKVVLLLLI